MNGIRNIVLNIPHSSTMGVKAFGWGDDVLPKVKRWTDWHTDKIFECEDKQVFAVIFPLSRFVCDVERLENDELEQIGQGIIYTRFEEVERDMEKVNKEYLMGLYHEHINELKSHLTDESLLIDCHSFPADLADVDVCIGFNNDWSKPDDAVLNMMKDTFKAHGYTVGINHPYSNSISPVMPFAYPSVMIELNKRVYSEEFETIRACISELYRRLLSL